MKLVTLLLVLSGTLALTSAIIRPVIRLRPKIVLGKHGLDGEDDALKIYRLIAKTVVSGYLFGAFRRPYPFSYLGPYSDSGPPLSVTFSVGSKHGYPPSTSESSKEAKVEKIKIIEKEKEKPVKHIVISHKILAPPATAYSMTGSGPMVPDIFQESAMAALSPEMTSSESDYSSSPWGETRQVKIVKVRESSAEDTSGDEDDSDSSDGEDDSSELYSSIINKRKVYSYKDEPVKEPVGFKYGYNPIGLGETVAMAESKRIVQKDNSTSMRIKENSSQEDNSNDKTENTSISPDTASSAEFNASLFEEMRKEKDAKLRSEIEDVGKMKLEKEINSSSSSSNENQKVKETGDDSDQWLKYLDEKEAQENALKSDASSSSSEQRTSVTVKSGKKLRKNRKRNRKSKKGKSRSKNRQNNRLGKILMTQNWEDVPLVEEKVDSVKAFGDNWVSKKRSKKIRRNRSKGRSSDLTRYRLARLPSTSSLNSKAFRSLALNHQMIALPSSSFIAMPSSSSLSPLSSASSLPSSWLSLSSAPIGVPNPIPVPRSLLSSAYFPNSMSTSYLSTRPMYF